jgi:hypothetical protein
MTNDELQDLAQLRRTDMTIWKIKGYDSLLGEHYTCPEIYGTRDEAQKRCRSNEWAEAISTTPAA